MPPSWPSQSFETKLTFHLQIPGGGVGIFNGCTTEWGAPSSGWGAQYGGISSATDCSSFPEALQAGCNWRFGWFEGADNPTVSFTQVACPAAITKNTGCIRADDTDEPAAAAVSGSTVAAVVASTSSAAAPVATSADPVASSADPVATTEAADPVATSAEAGVETTTSEDPVAPATAAADPPATTAAADPATTSAAEDDVCEL